MTIKLVPRMPRKPQPPEIERIELPCSVPAFAHDHRLVVSPVTGTCVSGPSVVVRMVKYGTFVDEFAVSRQDLIDLAAQLEAGAVQP